MKFLCDAADSHSHREIGKVALGKTAKKQYKNKVYNDGNND